MWICYVDRSVHLSLKTLAVTTKPPSTLSNRRMVPRFTDFIGL